MGKSAVAQEILPGVGSARVVECVDALVEAARAGRLVAFCGAGVSREFPTLAPLVADSGALPGLLVLLKEAVLGPLPIDLRKAAAKLLPAMGLEQFLEHVAAVVGDEALAFLGLLEAPGSGPNYRHLALARLAAGGCLRAIVTVNFDTYFERALADLGVPYSVPEEVSDEAAAYRTLFRGGGRLPLLKLHGTLRNPSSLITTIETVGLGLPRYKAGALRLAIEASDLLVAGYSDNDVDVFREIERVAMRGAVIWHMHDTPNPAQPEQARIASLLVALRHWVISGAASLNEVLAAVVERIDVAAPKAILAQLGVADLEELAAVEAREIGDRAAELRRRAALLTASWLSPEASALIVRRSLPEETAEQQALRRQLLGLVERGPARGARIEIARANQVAEEIADQGSVEAAIALRRRLLSTVTAKGDPRRTVALLEEECRLVGHELSQRRFWVDALLRMARIRWQLWRRADLAARDRERLRSILDTRLPAVVHRCAQGLLAGELRLRCRGAGWQRGLAAVLGWGRRRLAGVGARRYRKIVEGEFGAGFRGLAMMRVAELTLLRKETWTPEVDDLLAAARARTRPEWRLRTVVDEFHFLGIADGVRLLYLGDLPRARGLLEATYRYYAHRMDVGGGLSVWSTWRRCIWRAETRGRRGRRCGSGGS